MGGWAGPQMDWCQAHPGVGVDSSEAAFKQISPGLWCPLCALVLPVGGGCKGFKTIPARDPILHTCLPG